MRQPPNEFNLEAFKAELKALLAKHNCSLGVSVYGDTHGLTYDFYVDSRAGGGWHEFKLNNGNSLEACDL